MENIGNKADSLHRRIEQTYEEQICDAYVATLKPQIKKRHLGFVMLAFDFTDEDFYGYTSDLWLHPWTGEQGVQATYTFGVLSLVDKQKIPLMAVPVHCGMSKETLFSLFLAITKKLKLHVCCILLDAGFYSREVIEALQDYQNKYTANEFLALKIRGKLPQLPKVQPTSEPEPVVIPAPVIEQPVLEDGQLIEEDKTLSEAVVFDTAE